MKRLNTKRYILIFLAPFLITLQAAAQNNSNFDFVENKGQWDSRVKFTGDIGAGGFFLQQKGFTVDLKSRADLEKILHRHHPGSNAKSVSTAAAKTPAAPLGGPDGLRLKNDSFLIRSHAYQVEFVGASESAQIQPEKIQEFYHNYFIGNDPSKWKSDVKVYRAVVYRNIYPGIDIRYYADNGTLKYDFIVNPGANASLITMKYTGADKLSIRNNQLIISTSVGEVKELAPYSYQFDGPKGKKEIGAKYEIINGNTVKFKLKAYSGNLPLIIDPTLIFSSFTGGSDNYGFTATPGPDGALFSGSTCFLPGFPTTPGAYDQSFGGGSGNRGTDMGIMKFSRNGTARLYATYLGGGENDSPHSLICDPQGNLVIMGRTYSSNFPGTLVGPGGGQGSSDLVVAKLSANGNSLIGALRIGGNANDGINIKDQLNSGIGRSSTIRFYGDDARGEVNLDPAGNIYIASQTQSNNFPIVNAFQPAFGGGLQDGVVLKINPTCTGIIWSSYLGGSGDDAAFVIDLSPTTNQVFVAGATASGNFPGTNATVVQPANAGGGADGFVTEINNAGGSIVRSTYLGTPSYDAIYGLKFDRFGFPYVMGISDGSWRVFNAAFVNPGSKQFVSKLSQNLSAYVYSTVYGSGSALPNISPIAFLVDRCENIYISGWGGWISNEADPFGQSGTTGMPTTPDALKLSTDNKDFYFIVIKKDAASLLYGSFFGQGGGFGEHVDGGTSRFDQQGVIYQALCANCFGGQLNPPYLTTPGAVGPVNGAGQDGCNLGALKISFNYAGVDAGVRAFIGGAFDTTGCVPLTVTFRDTVRNAKNYIWNFGDGSPDTATSGFEVSHTYNNVGTYRLMLVGVDSTTCNIRDTAYTTVTVRDDQAFLGFTATKLPPCQSLSYRFDNTSTSPAAKPFGNTSFIWDFGDGTRVPSGPGALTHSYASPGTYVVKLIMPDTNYCNSPDSISQTLRVAPLVDALFETPAAGCAPYDAVFNNISLAGQTFFWDFGDGTTSTDINPTHTYLLPGTFTIKLVATDPATCNIIDSTSTTITISSKPTAAFTYSPLTAQENFPYTFTNTSSPDATLFNWDFGDGDTLRTRSRSDIEHLYNATGTFTACLFASNDIGCVDTVCVPLQSIIVPKLDLPNAFTPLGNSLNNVIYVRGYGIARMQWRIYNRFGNLVFETADRTKGWDGKFKGVVQPMDVYAYTLEVEFSDGTRTTKKGDITLIR
ncbi:MAG: PKD domain-containing protein [Gemmatimonadaceae bacterium]|nr:PKD domain-containing protein [Chitinophagaceae bacterium]